MADFDQGPSAIPPRGLWEVFVRGWRPFSGWVFGLVVVERSLVFPAYQLANRLPVDPVDWVPLTALAGLLVVARSYDRSKGTA